MKKLTRIGLILALVGFVYTFLIQWWLFPYTTKPKIHYYLMFLTGLSLLVGLILMVISGSIVYKGKK